MTGNGHRLFGLYGACVIFPEALNMGWTGYLAAIGLFLGANAPDYLEIRTKNGTLITHRTITHYLPLWVALLLTALGGLGIGPLNGQFTLPAAGAELLLGFSLGGLLHLVLDFPNPMGIPVVLPHKRISLNLWRSGRREWLMHTAAICALVWHFTPAYIATPLKTALLSQ